MKINSIIKLVFILLLLNIFSCQTYKKWYEKGTKKGWIKDTVLVKDTVKILIKDTLFLNKLADSTNKSIEFTIDSIFNLKDSLKVDSLLKIKLKQNIKSKIITKIRTIPIYKDDSLIINNSTYNAKILVIKGKIFYKIKVKPQIIKNDVKWYQVENFWILIIIGMFVGILLALLIKK